VVTVAETLIVRVVTDSASARRDISDLERMLGRAGGGGGGGLFGGGTGQAQALGTAAATLATGIAGAVREAGKMEQIGVGFKTLLGSADAANAKIAELQDFAAKTPFNFQGVANLSRQLLAMGTSSSELVPVMTDLGDAVAALGLGDDALQRIVFNFGQIQTQGKLTMREMRDFAINGIPVFDILQKELGLTEKQLREIGDQGISADIGLAALRKGMRERFGGAMEAQNKTLFGSFSNLTDSVQRLAASLGAPLIGPITFATRLITDLVNAIDKAPGIVKNLITVVTVGLTTALAVKAGRMALASFQVGRYTAQLIANTAALNTNTAAAQRNAGAGATAGSKGGRFAGVGGLIAGGAAAAAAFAGPETFSGLGSGLGGAVGRTVQGAGIGGSFAGGPGALVGGTIGALVNAIEQTMKLFAPQAQAQAQQAKKSPEQASTDRNTAAMEALTAELKNLGVGSGFDKSDVAGRWQAMIARDMAAAL
jgi:tape measure domain-containing protein